MSPVQLFTVKRLTLFCQFSIAYATDILNFSWPSSCFLFYLFIYFILFYFFVLFLLWCCSAEPGISSSLSYLEGSVYAIGGPIYNHRIYITVHLSCPIFSPHAAASYLLLAVFVSGLYLVTFRYPRNSLLHNCTIILTIWLWLEMLLFQAPKELLLKSRARCLQCNHYFFSHESFQVMWRIYFIFVWDLCVRCRRITKSKTAHLIPYIPVLHLLLSIPGLISDLNG